MRVTFVNRLMGIVRGGGEYFDINAARALQRLGVEVRFVTGRRLSRLDMPIEEFETVYIPTPYMRWFSYRYESRSFRPLSALAARVRRFDEFLFGQAALRHLRRDTRTDVFQFSAWAPTAARLAATGRRTVVFWPGPPQGANAAASRRCSASFSNGIGYEEGKKVVPEMKCINIGCDIDRFRPPPWRERVAGRCRFLFVGRCIPVKNLYFLIEGFAQARKERPGISLDIVGTGQDLPGLRAKVGELRLGESVALSGWVSDESVLEHYHQADVFTLVSRYECFPLVMPEAMACGLPLIFSDVCVLPKLIKDYQAGSVVRLGDVDDLARSMVYYADHPEERAAIGERNRRTAEMEFSWEHTARRMLELYESVL